MAFTQTLKFESLYPTIHICVCKERERERERYLEDKGIVGGFSGGGKKSRSHGRLDVATVRRGT